MSLPNRPSLVQHGQFCFLIMDAPTDHNLSAYIKELTDRSVGVVVRTCEPTYSGDRLRRHQIRLEELHYPDGQPPNEKIIERFLRLAESEQRKGHPLAVHCVAGLGRSPVLVAVALVELALMDPAEAVQLIRAARRGAINQKQYAWLKAYQPKRGEACCLVM